MTLKHRIQLKVVSPTMVISLFSVPTEILDQILSCLEYWDVLALRVTCKDGLEVVSEKAVAAAKDNTISALLAAERAEHERREEKSRNFLTWANRFPSQNRTYWSSDSVNNIHVNCIQKTDKLTCYSCFKELPRRCFARTQCTRRRSLGHRDAGLRFCMKCGVEKGKWEPGKVIKAPGGGLVVCHRCQELKKTNAQARKEGLCPDCFNRKNQAELAPSQPRIEPPRDQPVSQPQARHVPSIKERAGRCQRCWAIDHTEQPAMAHDGIQPLCASCFSLISGTGTGSSVVI